MQPRLSSLRQCSNRSEALCRGKLRVRHAINKQQASTGRTSMLDRRNLIKRAGAGAFVLGSGVAFGALEALALDTVTLPFENGERPLGKYPQKRPMIGLTSRPPQLETPCPVCDQGAITPKDAS